MKQEKRRFISVRVKILWSLVFVSVSFMIAVVLITTIVYMRWGWWGGIHAVLAGIVFCFFQGASPQQYLIYMGGNLFSIISVFVLSQTDSSRITEPIQSATIFPSSGFFTLSMLPQISA